MNLKKVFILTIIATLLISTITFIWSKSISKFKNEQVIDKKIKELQDIILTMPNDSSVSLKKMNSKHRLILVFFNSECNLCHTKASEIYKNLEKFSSSVILFVSNEPFSNIKNFARDTNLDSINNVHFAKMEIGTISFNYGAVATPHIFIYNHSGKLINEFMGEVKIDLILNSL